MSQIVSGNTDALAAEYVLGTLDPEERTQARALLEIDQEFVAKVHLWERRLGELHLMVEPVEPDGKIWDRIKAKMPEIKPVAEIAPPPEAPQPSPDVPAAKAPSPSLDAVPAATKIDETPTPVPSPVPRIASGVEPGTDSSGKPGPESRADSPVPSSAEPDPGSGGAPARSTLRCADAESGGSAKAGRCSGFDAPREAGTGGVRAEKGQFGGGPRELEPLARRCGADDAFGPRRRRLARGMAVRARTPAPDAATRRADAPYGCLELGLATATTAGAARIAIRRIGRDGLGFVELERK
jgi:hypothetical protein